MAAYWPIMSDNWQFVVYSHQKHR